MDSKSLLLRLPCVLCECDPLCEWMTQRLRLFPLPLYVLLVQPSAAAQDSRQGRGQGRAAEIARRTRTITPHTQYNERSWDTQHTQQCGR